MEQIIMNMTLLIGIIGVLAFAVSIITQVFKGVSGLKKIPTDGQSKFVLPIVAVTAFVAYMQYIQQTIYLIATCPFVRCRNSLVAYSQQSYGGKKSSVAVIKYIC